MNFPGFITIKDFFNYYVSGFLWFLNFVLIYLPINDRSKLINELEQLQKITDKISPVIMGLILLIFPYVIGFILTPLNTIVTKLLRRIFGDPKNWVVDYQTKSGWRIRLHKGKRLSKTNICLIIKRLKKIYGEEKEINETNFANWFFQVRAIVINQKGEAGALAIRAQDLVNFTESILLSVPLMLWILFLKYIVIKPEFAWICLGIGLLFFVILSYRYLRLRTYWIKHTYRAFLAEEYKFKE